MIDFSLAKEIQPYNESPRSTDVGTTGKTGYLLLGFELDMDGKSILRDLDRRVPLIVQQELYFDEQMPEMPCVYILSSGGPNVDGDRYEQHFTVGKDAYGFISTGAATKLAEMRYNYSGLSQFFTLDKGAYLEYLPEPIIPCRNTRFISDTEITIHPTATLFYSEIFTGGRKYFGNGERFAYDMISICTHAQRPNKDQLMREKFIIRPQVNPPSKLGVMADYDIFANVVVMTPKSDADEIYRQTEAFIDNDRHLAVGITHLPNESGLLYRVLGDNTELVKATVRKFCSTVRLQIKHKPLPDEFPWR